MLSKANQYYIAHYRLLCIIMTVDLNYCMDHQLSTIQQIKLKYYIYSVTLFNNNHINSQTTWLTKKGKRWNRLAFSMCVWEVYRSSSSWSPSLQHLSLKEAAKYHAVMKEVIIKPQLKKTHPFAKIHVFVSTCKLSYSTIPQWVHTNQACWKYQCTC